MANKNLSLTYYQTPWKDVFWPLGLEGKTWIMKNQCKKNFKKLRFGKKTCNRGGGGGGGGEQHGGGGGAKVGGQQWAVFNL